MASSRVTMETLGTERITSSRTISRRLRAALLTPRFTSSVSASSSSSLSTTGCASVIGHSRPLFRGGVQEVTQRFLRQRLGQEGSAALASPVDHLHLMVGGYHRHPD